MSRALRIAGSILAALVALLLATLIYIHFVWDKPVDRPAPVMTAPHDSATIARGEHIFKDTWQCWRCHASPATDGNSSPSGGRVFDLRSRGPGFGIYYARNITPDSSTGIGAWTDGEIVQAIREGVRKDRHMLFPLMPVDWLKGLSDRDVLAVVAYIRTIPPVTNRVPDSEPSFFSRALMTFHVLEPMPPITRPVGAPPPGPTAEYGRYFATSVGGCAECHSPRNLQTARFYEDSLFAGSTIAFGSEQGDPLVSYGRDIRPVEGLGIGHWNEEDFTAAVTSGMRPDSTVLDPHMPYAQFKFLSGDEVRAVYLFLRSLEPMGRTAPAPWYSVEVKQAKGTERGKLLFRARCQPCHGLEGTGARPTSVRLTEVESSMDDRDLKDFIAAGQLNLKMPAFRKTLDSTELDDVAAYIRSWKKQ
jgi:mono/diheme cytochrome c family protein